MPKLFAFFGYRVAAPGNAPVPWRALVVSVLATAGCGGPLATVTGRVTCQDRPVSGVILVSPKGEDPRNSGPSVNAPLGEDGSFKLRLTSLGKHTIVITPRDITYPPRPGEFDYPCDRSPLERDIKAGDNDLTIELARRTR
jgi:hypothetical protein